MTKEQIEKLINRYAHNGLKMRKTYSKCGAPTINQQVQDEKLWNELKEELKLDNDGVINYLKTNYPQHYKNMHSN